MHRHIWGKYPLLPHVVCIKPSFCSTKSPDSLLLRWSAIERCNCRNAGGRTFAGTDLEAFVRAMIWVSMRAGSMLGPPLTVTGHDEKTP